MPQAILLQDVDALGERGAVVDVSAGYLRNFLLPRKLAEPATDSSIKVAQRPPAGAVRP
jgi:large subunit ribosomal protein L9